MLTLRGEVDGRALRSFNSYSTSYKDKPYRDKVISVIAEEGTVLPEDSKRLFYQYKNCTSIDLSNVDTSKVTNMEGLFLECPKLTSINLSGFDTSNVTDMGFMFSGCSSLTSLDLSSFDTSKVTDMGYMFGGCSGLTELDVRNFDTSNVTNMGSMFFDCSGLTELDVRNFDTSKVEGTGSMFMKCTSLTSLDLSGFDTSNVEFMTCMFMDCTNLTKLDLNGFDTSNVSNMYDMFLNCNNLTSLDLSGFDTSKVNNMGAMFRGCSDLTELDLSNFNTSNVQSMDLMFYDCSKLTSLDLSGFDTSKVNYMGDMFRGCSDLIELDLSNFNTSNVKDMGCMFQDCSKLTSLDLSGFDTSKVTDMLSMFNGCSNLNSLDLSGFDTSNGKNISGMFKGCSQLKTLILGEKFELVNKYAQLSNGNGWVNVKDPTKVISSNGDYAVFYNNGKTTYKLYGTITYPTNIKVSYNLEYRQARLTWDKVIGADKYGIAVYVAGKWMIQTQNITTNSYTTPKNSISPGSSYKVAVAARVNGKWDSENAIKNAVTINISNEGLIDSDRDGIPDDKDALPNTPLSDAVVTIEDYLINDDGSMEGINYDFDIEKKCEMKLWRELCNQNGDIRTVHMDGSSISSDDSIKDIPKKNALIYTRARKRGKIDAKFKITPNNNSDFSFTITDTKETMPEKEYTTDDFNSTVEVYFDDQKVDPVEIRLNNNNTEITYVFALAKDHEYTIHVNNPTKNHIGTYEIHVSEDNWVYVQDGGMRYIEGYMDSTYVYYDYLDVFFGNSLLIEMLNKRYSMEKHSLTYYNSNNSPTIAGIANFFFDEEETLGIDKNKVTDKLNDISTGATYLGLMPGPLGPIFGVIGAGSTLGVIYLDNNDCKKFKDDIKEAINECVYLPNGDINLCYTHYKRYVVDHSDLSARDETVNTWTSWNSPYFNKYVDGRRCEITKEIDFKVFDLVNQ